MVGQQKDIKVVIEHTCDIKDNCDGQQCECEVGYDIASYWECIHCCECNKQKVVKTID